MMNFRHLFKLIWNRRKMNLLMIIEIFISFIVLFILVQSLVKFAFYYSEQLGFNYKNVWNLEINTNNVSDEIGRQEMELIKNELRSFPEIVNFSEAFNIPYTSLSITTNIDYNGKTISNNLLLADDNYADVLEIELVEGRWFNEADNASAHEPVIINKKFKEALFPDVSAIGKTLQQKENIREIIGVIDQIKKRGELNDYGKILFKRINPHNPKSWLGENLLIKVKVGTGIEFEEKLMRRLSLVSKNFSLEMISMEDMRERAFTKYTSVAYIFGFVCIFLVVNVALGLFGVLWYNINFRRSEIGLRRTVGSTAPKIYQQIIGETLILSTFSIIIGSFFVLNLKILITNFLRTDIFYTSYFVTVFIIYLITAICAFYPSKLAAEIEPAETMHYE
ncbi:MAG: ABC transporter permease [Candidatus Cloacimonetes bacterium]|nr:ABC transporter permease [Candidatus Cloacimonadota bacterium]